MSQTNYIHQCWHGIVLIDNVLIDNVLIDNVLIDNVLIDNVLIDNVLIDNVLINVAHRLQIKSGLFDSDRFFFRLVIIVKQRFSKMSPIS